MMNVLKVFKRNKPEQNVSGSQPQSFIKDKLREEFAPLIDKSQSVLSPAKSWLKAHPALSFGIMMGILVANFLVLLLFTNAYKTSSADTLKALNTAAASVRQTGGDHASIGQAMSDYRNYETVKAMRDSAQFLLSKKHLTREDSLTFIRMAETLQQMQQSIPSLQRKELESKK